MKASTIVRILTGIAVAGLLSSTGARAEDTKGKWQFGFGLSYYSTIDYIRSNADLAVSSKGVVDENGLPAVQSVDERPDGNITNQPSIKDNFRIDFNASYGLTRWLALEVASSYMKSPVGNIEVYTTNSSIGFNGDGSASDVIGCGPVPASGGTPDPDFPNAAVPQPCYSYSPQPPFDVTTNSFVPVGDITEIPVNLSALVRFRPESPFDPYVGLGVGYVMTNLTTSDRFKQVGDFMSQLKVTSASRGEYTLQQIRADASGNPIYPDKVVPDPGYSPKPLAAEVRNSFEWHAIGGVDYYMNDRFSMYVDARYSWNTGAVNITADGFHQVRLASPDYGRLVRLQRGSVSDPYLWEDIGGGSTAVTAFQNRCASNPMTLDGQPLTGFACRGDGYYETEDKNANGIVDYPDASGQGVNEDDGIIYVLPPGTADPNDRLDDMTFYCPSCDGNRLTGGGTEIIDSSGKPTGKFLERDTEDANYNRMLDRFLYYGVDICSTQEGAGNPLCENVNVGSATRFVFPGGCRTVVPDPNSTPPPEGCPPITSKAAQTLTSSDDVSDIFLAQGGRIHLGGFSLGFGFKISF